MRTIKLKVLSALFALAVLASCNEKSTPDSKLLLSGSGWNKIVMLDKQSKNIEWEYVLDKGTECNSLGFDKDGNIVFAYAKGAAKITPEKNIIWDIKSPEGTEMQTATVLDNGNTLIAWCGKPAKIMEVDDKGKIVSETTFDTGIEGPHSQFRQITKNKKGNYMVPLFGTSELCEVEPNGNILKKVSVEGNPFSSLELPNGNYIVACGDAHSWVELDFEKGEVVKRVGEKDIENTQLFFVAQLYPSSNKGYYVCNWPGHADRSLRKTNAQVFEIDANGQKIWELHDYDNLGMISTIAVQ